MEKINFNQKKTVDAAGRVQVCETYTLPRYSARAFGGCDWVCESTIDDLKSAAIIWVGSREFSSLTNIPCPSAVDDLLTGDLQKDLAAFQKFLNREYGRGKYEAFVLGAYVHGSADFSINKSGNRVCRWDSSQVGFIGLPRKKDDFYCADNAANVANELSAAWNGEYVESQVVDNLTDDIVDAITTADYIEEHEWRKQAEEKYGVDFDSVETVY